MASITRKILGKDKDICYMAGDTILGIVFNQQLLTLFKQAPSTAERKIAQAALKKAKARDGVSSASVGLGVVSYNAANNEVNITFESTAFVAHDYTNDIVTTSSGQMYATTATITKELLAHLSTHDRKCVTLSVSNEVGHDMVTLAMDVSHCENADNDLSWVRRAVATNLVKFAQEFSTVAADNALDMAVIENGAGRMVAETLHAAGVAIKEPCAAA